MVQERVEPRHSTRELRLQLRIPLRPFRPEGLAAVLSIGKERLVLARPTVLGGCIKHRIVLPDLSNESPGHPKLSLP